MTFALGRLLITAMWAAWGALWVVAAFFTKPARWRESIGSRTLCAIRLFACGALLVEPRWLPSRLSTRIVLAAAALATLGTLTVAAGLTFALWARVYFGWNWSGTVTVKEGHTLIRTGPYRLMRHPIYTGCPSP